MLSETMVVVKTWPLSCSVSCHSILNYPSITKNLHETFEILKYYFGYSFIHFWIFTFEFLNIRNNFKILKEALYCCHLVFSGTYLHLAIVF